MRAGQGPSRYISLSIQDILLSSYTESIVSCTDTMDDVHHSCQFRKQWCMYRKYIHNFELEMNFIRIARRWRVCMKRLYNVFIPLYTFKKLESTSSVDYKWMVGCPPQFN